MEKTVITEEMKVHEKWYEEAENQTLETLPDFIKNLTENYSHDYGTICHAIAASAIAAAYAVNESPTGGITGFQAGAVMWEFIRNWKFKRNKSGLRIIDYDDMLYPQYEEKFTTKVISESTWNRLQEQAYIYLSKDSKTSHPNVVKHWKKITRGYVPFGYRVDRD